MHCKWRVAAHESLHILLFCYRYLVGLADKQQLPAVAGVVMMASASLTACIPNMEWWQAQQSSMHAVKAIW